MCSVSHCRVALGTSVMVFQEVVVNQGIKLRATVDKSIHILIIHCNNLIQTNGEEMSE